MKQSNILYSTNNKQTPNLAGIGTTHDLSLLHIYLTTITMIEKKNNDVNLLDMRTPLPPNL